ncbi:MAG: hypothetical protein AMXMBFR61_27160 [Fimbriimonadales bacterium]
MNRIAAVGGALVLYVMALCATALAQREAAPISDPVRDASSLIGKVSGELRHHHITLGDGPPPLAPGPLTLYDNNNSFTGYYLNNATLYPADDLHMAAAGVVNGFNFVYYDGVGGDVAAKALVQFWINNPADSIAAGPIASYLISGLPGAGLWEISISLGAGLEFSAPQDVWMSLRILRSDNVPCSGAGWAIYDPPSVGASHDLFADVLGPWVIYWFGGTPKANFGSVVFAGSTVQLPVPVDLNGQYLGAAQTTTPHPGLAIAGTQVTPYGQVVERSGPGTPNDWDPNVVEGTFTPFSDDVKPPRLLSVTAANMTFQADLDLTGSWQSGDMFGIAVGGGGLMAGAMVTLQGSVYRIELGSRLMLAPWTMQTGGTPFIAAPTNTQFRVLVNVDLTGKLSGSVTPLNGAGAGMPVSLGGPYDPTIGGYSLPGTVGFAAGFVCDTNKTLAAAEVTNFVTNRPDDVLFAFLDDPYVRTSELAFYRFGMANLTQLVSGYQQFFASSGPQTLVDLGSLGAYYTGLPFPNHLLDPRGISTSPGLAAGITLPGSPTQINATLATLPYDPSVEGLASLAIMPDNGNPLVPTRFTSPTGTPILPGAMHASNLLVIDDTPPSLGNLTAKQGLLDVLGGINPVVQGPLVITVDARDLWTLTPNNGAGLENYPLISIDFPSGPDVLNQPMHALAGNTFGFDATVTAAHGCGTATITITASDDAGNVAALYGSLALNTKQVSVTVELRNVHLPLLATVKRAVQFDIGGLGGTNPVVSTLKNVDFSDPDGPGGLFASGTVLLTAVDAPIPCTGTPTHISAKDRLHTLRKTIALTGVSPNFTASFTGLASALPGGDANGDNLIDILDFGMLAWRFGQNLGADTPVGTPYDTASNPHPDFSANGLVGTEDYSFIQIGFLTTGDALVGPFVPQGTPRATATVREMLDAGIRIAPFFDLDRDGWVTMAEIAEWLWWGGRGGPVGR